MKTGENIYGIYDPKKGILILKMLLFFNELRYIESVWFIRLRIQSLLASMCEEHCCERKNSWTVLERSFLYNYQTNCETYQEEPKHNYKVVTKG